MPKLAHVAVAPTDDSAARNARLTALWPLVAACALVLGATVITIARGLVRPQPDNPYESGQIVEAWRALHGLPVYEDWATGHATHMYGALAPYLLGAIFRVTGSGVWVGRLLAVTAAAAIVALLTRIALHGARPAWWFALLMVAMLVGIDLRAGNYFVHNRPDVLSILVGLLALCAMYRGYARDSVAWYLGGTALLVVAFFLKQPAAGFALIPLVAIVLEEGRRGRKRWWALAALPLATSIAVIALLSRFAPEVYFYMVTMPRSAHISLARAIDTLALLLTGFPILIVCLARLLTDGAGWRDLLFARGRLWLWTLAAVATQVPPSVAAVAKLGGETNSLLPAMFAIVLFCGLALREWLPDVMSRGTIATRRLWAAFLGALVLLTFPRAYVSVGFTPSFADYHDVIAYVSGLRGHEVDSPEDGTITTAALGKASPSVYLLYDAAGWTDTTPDLVKRQLRAAEYVVDAKDWYQDLIRSDLLRSLGFQPVRDFPHYTVWRRAGAR